MPIMPYAMEKGPYLSVIEGYLNADADRAVRMLEDLRAGVALTDLGPLDPPMAGSPYDPATLKAHVKRDWWGRQPVFDNAGTIVSWNPQAQFDPSTKPTTGFWQHWYGESELVFRQTLVRALEVSLGVSHPPGSGAGVTVNRTRHWPISMFWNCPHPWYEGWVCWQRRNRAERGGVVVVVVNTPAHRPPPDEKGTHHNGELFNSPLRPAGGDPEKIEPYFVEPTDAVARNGMWLVSQVYHQEWTPPASSSSGPPGTWRPPVLGRPVRSVGEVLTVAIAEIDGGVLPDGRPFPPTP